jgi:hypothetical protein
MRALCHASGVASIAEQIAGPLLLEWLASLTADEREIATWPDARISLSAGRIGMVTVIPFFLVRIVATLSQTLCLDVLPAKAHYIAVAQSRVEPPS